MGVVERRSSLRSYSARRMDSYEGVGGAMGCVKLEELPQGRCERSGDQGCSPMHAHRPATWERAVCAGTGGADKSPAGSAQRRPSGERRRCETNGIQFRVLVALRGGGERPVCPQVSSPGFAALVSGPVAVVPAIFTAGSGVASLFLHGVHYFTCP